MSAPTHKITIPEDMKTSVGGDAANGIPKLGVPDNTDIRCAFDTEGTIWLNAGDVCELLDFNNTSSALQQISDTEKAKLSNSGDIRPVEGHDRTADVEDVVDAGLRRRAGRSPWYITNKAVRELTLGGVSSETAELLLMGIREQNGKDQTAEVKDPTADVRGQTADVKSKLHTTFHDIDVRIVDTNPVTVVLKDVSEALGYQTGHLKRAIKEKYKGFHLVDTPGGAQKMSCVTRPGLSQALATLQPQDTDKQELLEEFQTWLYEEVLESIYETGQYTTDVHTTVDRTAELVLGNAEAISGITNIITEQQKMLQRVEAKTAEVEKEAARNHEAMLARVEELEQSLEMSNQDSTATWEDPAEMSWDEMRSHIEQLRTTRMARVGSSNHTGHWRWLYDDMKKNAGVNVDKIYEKRGGPSKIKSLTHEEMQVAVECARIVFT